MRVSKERHHIHFWVIYTFKAIEMWVRVIVQMNSAAGWKWVESSVHLSEGNVLIVDGRLYGGARAQCPRGLSKECRAVTMVLRCCIKMTQTSIKTLVTMRLHTELRTIRPVRITCHSLGFYWCPKLKSFIHNSLYFLSAHSCIHVGRN